MGLLHQSEPQQTNGFMCSFNMFFGHQLMWWYMVITVPPLPLLWMSGTLHVYFSDVWNEHVQKITSCRLHMYK